MGTKRRRVVASAANNSAVAGVGTVVILFQVVPSVVYCQLPFVVSKFVRAMPLGRGEIESLGSVMLPIIADINVPLLLVSLALIAVKLGVPELSRTGELLTVTVPAHQLLTSSSTIPPSSTIPARLI